MNAKFGLAVLPIAGDRFRINVCAETRNDFVATGLSTSFFRSLRLFESIKFKLEDLEKHDGFEFSGWTEVRRFSAGDVELTGFTTDSRLILQRRIERPDVAIARDSRKLRKSGFRILVLGDLNGDDISVSVRGRALKISAPSSESGWRQSTSEESTIGYVDRFCRTTTFTGLSAPWIDRSTALAVSEVAVDSGNVDLARKLWLEFAPPFGESFRWNLIAALFDPDLIHLEVKEIDSDSSPRQVLLSQSLEESEVTILGPNPPQIVEIAQVEVQRGSLMITNEVEVNLDDHAAHPKFGFVAGNWNFIAAPPGTWNQGRLMPLGAQRQGPWRIESAATILGRCSSNYFHCLIEYLPRLVTLRRSAPSFDGPILINSDYPSTIIDLLDQLIPRDRQIRVDRETRLHVERLLVPTFHSRILDTDLIPWATGAGLDHVTLEEFRSICLKLQSEHAFPTKIFLIRSVDSANNRSLTNQTEISRIAAEHGYTSIDPGKMPIRDQIAMFNSATHIAGAGGAAFANLLFCRPGTRVLGLVSEPLESFAIHSTIARLQGSEFRYLTGPISLRRRHMSTKLEAMHLPFSISPTAFRQALQSFDD